MNYKDLVTQNVPTLEGEGLDKMVSLLENTAKSAGEKSYSEATKNAYGNIDESLVNLGFEKPDDKKTTEYFVEVFTNLQSEKKSFEEKLKTGKITDDKEYVDKFKALEKIINDNKVAHANELKTFHSESEKKVKKLAILSSFPNLETTFSASMFNVLKTKAVNDLMDLSVYEDGKIIFKDENGLTKTNPANENKPFSTLDILKTFDYFAPVFEKTPPNLPPPNRENNHSKDVEAIKAKLIERGLKEGTRSFFEALKKELT